MVFTIRTGLDERKADVRWWWWCSWLSSCFLGHKEPIVPSVCGFWPTSVASWRRHVLFTCQNHCLSGSSLHICCLLFSVQWCDKSCLGADLHLASVFRLFACDGESAPLQGQDKCTALTLWPLRSLLLTHFPSLFLCFSSLHYKYFSGQASCSPLLLS